MHGSYALRTFVLSSEWDGSQDVQRSLCRPAIPFCESDEAGVRTDDEINMLDFEVLQERFVWVVGGGVFVFLACIP